MTTATPHQPRTGAPRADDATGPPQARLPATYLLPLRTNAPYEDLAPYLTRLAALVEEVLVVDGSPADVFAAHGRAWPTSIRHVSVDDGIDTANGKVAGVLTGLHHAAHDRVVIADDDVRYDAGSLARVVALLDVAEAVVPQNVFTDMPWHARWDTARTLLNRALVGTDYPGTLGVRRDLVLDVGGYDGDVLFENLELLRTVRAAGGRVLPALDLVVPREPPTAHHFVGQRVRQAYDSFAQPARLLAELALLPAAAALRRRWGARGPAALAGAIVLVAEAGRRRAGGRATWSRSAALWAPAWAAERAVCAWLAVGARSRGGVRYRDGRIRRAATPLRTLRRRIDARGSTAGAATRRPVRRVG